MLPWWAYFSHPHRFGFAVAAATSRLPDGTWVPRGSMVIYNSYAMGRSKQIWGEDAAEFRPERWLNAEPKEPVGSQPGRMDGWMDG